MRQSEVASFSMVVKVVDGWIATGLDAASRLRDESFRIDWTCS